MKKAAYVIETVCVFAVTLLMILFLNKLTRPVNTDTTAATIAAFHELPENSLDVICYGSSHMWKGLDTGLLNNKYGISCYNYGCNWQHLNTTRLFVEDSLMTQKPKIAIIDTWKFNSLIRNAPMNGEVYYTKYLKRTPSLMRYLSQCFGTDLEKYLAYAMPVAVFHDNWKNTSLESFQPITQEKETFLESRGFNSKSQVGEVTIPDISQFPQKALSERASAELDYITGLLQKHGAQIIFITIPYTKEFKYLNAVEEYAVQHGFVHLNMFNYLDEAGIDAATDFFDEGHLNDSGAAKVADFVGRYLTENCGDILF